MTCLKSMMPISSLVSTHEEAYDMYSILLVMYPFETVISHHIISFCSGIWCKEQRNAYSEGILPENRITMLNQVGFNFYHGRKSAAAKKSDPWQRRISELKAYKAKTGTTNVPKKFELNLGLGDFVYNQRMVSVPYESSSIWITADYQMIFTLTHFVSYTTYDRHTRTRSSPKRRSKHLKIWSLIGLYLIGKLRRVKRTRQSGRLGSRSWKITRTIMET